MPWAPELFSAPVVQGLLDKYRRERLRSVPFFDGLVSGEVDALVESFSGVPEVHHPVRGRIKGEGAFRRFVTDMTVWLAARNVEVEHVNLLITDPRGVEEVVLHLDGDGGRVGLPLALTADHDEDERIVELRLYFSSWPLTGRHANRPPLLQPDLGLHEPDVVGEYQRALATGDVEAILATFEPDGYMREPAGGAHVHRGSRRAARALRAVLLQRRRHPAGALHRHRRRPRLRAGVQRGRLGPDGPGPRGGPRRLRARRQRQARRRARLRRLRPAAERIGTVPARGSRRDREVGG